MNFDSKKRSFLIVCGAIAALALGTLRAQAEALLLVEADTGKVLHAENATYPWYPASITKIMTAYVTLRAVKERRVTLDSVFTVSANAVAQQPSKMGFAAGTQVTLDNALKMLMVKSANDMAVVLAEGVSGSIENFANEMNRASKRLGMTQSSWVNPNGLPADEQITSARDMAILARAVIKEFPEYEMYWRIPAIKFGRRMLRNYNTLIDRYPGADGMKTGFICASGFNLVATATRNNKRLIAIVLGAYSGLTRAEKAAQLFERGFNGGGLSWLMPSLGTVDALTPIAAAPPNLRDEMCGAHRKRPPSEANDEEQVTASGPDGGAQVYAFMFGSANGKHGKPASLLGHLPPSMPPVPVFVGPARKPTVVAATTPRTPAMPGAAATDAASAPFVPGDPAARTPPAAAANFVPVAAAATALVPMPRPRPKR